MAHNGSAVVPGSAVVSGEGVRLALTTAGIGSRAIAASIDLAIQAVGYSVITLVTVLAAGASDSDGLTALLLVEVIAVLAGYPIVFEWLARGRTPGKMWIGLRVVRDDGGPIGLRQALVRGLAGLILEKPGLLPPFSTMAGVTAIGASPREKRIGDMMAGTIVLNEKVAAQPLGMPALWVPEALRPWVLGLDLHGLDDRLVLTLRQFVSRAYAMNTAGQTALGEELRRRVLTAVHSDPPPGVPTSVLLLSVLAERRRRAGEPVVSAWPAFAAAPAYGSPVHGPTAYAPPSTYAPPPAYVPPSPYAPPSAYAPPSPYAPPSAPAPAPPTSYPPPAERPPAEADREPPPDNPFAPPA